MMSNHYHILLETPEANLVAGMKWFQGTYTQRFNAANDCRGHLYQGRYKALIVDPDEDGYFNTVSTYIHLNPFRAGLAGIGCGKALEAYTWSSYPAFLQPPSKRPAWLEVHRVLESFGLSGHSRKIRMQYQSCLEERMAFEHDPAKAQEVVVAYRDIRRGWLMGGADFREWILEQMDNVGGGQNDNLRGEQRRAHGEKAAECLLASALESLGVNEQTLCEMKQSCLEKQAVAWLLQTKTTVSGVWIAARLQMGHRMNVSRAVTRFRASGERDVKRLKKKMLLCAG
jgi:hypothetical protein